MPVLAEYLLPLVKIWGGVLALKKAKAARRKRSLLKRALKILGGGLRQLVKVELPGVAEERYLVMMDKTAATPPGYPRKAGTPAQKPL